MGSSPAYANIVNNGAALLGAAETDLVAPAQSSLILTAGTNGAKIEEITVEAAKAGTLVATTVAGLVYLFLYDPVATVYRLFDVLVVTAVTPSATAAPFRITKPYNNLVLGPNWLLRASQSVAGNASLLVCHAFGGNY